MIDGGFERGGDSLTQISMCFLGEKCKEQKYSTFEPAGVHGGNGKLEEARFVLPGHHQVNERDPGCQSSFIFALNQYIPIRFLTSVAGNQVRRSNEEYGLENHSTRSHVVIYTSST
jgi:hypothetical protein